MLPDTLVVAVLDGVDACMADSVLVNDLSGVELANIRIMTGLTAAWFVALGASLGSFLNVVVYRLPLGKSLWRSPSACPHCGTRIRSSDNIPVLGWIKLVGKCRSCQWPIPVRYPLVELVVGLQFLVVLFATVISGGKTLPNRPPDHYAGVVWTVWYAKYPDLLQIFGFHCLGLYLLLAICLMGWDGRRVPQKFVSFCLATMGLYAFIFPAVYPQANLILTFSGFSWDDRFWALGTALGGWLVGGALGAIQVSGRISKSIPCLHSGWIFAMGLAGAIFGWKAALALSIVLIPCWLLLALWSHLVHANQIHWIWLTLPAFSTLLAVNWKAIDQWISMLVAGHLWWVLLSVLLISGMIARIPIPSRIQPSVTNEPPPVDTPADAPAESQTPSLE